MEDLVSIYMKVFFLCRCHYNLKMQWHSDVGTSPFAAPPLIADLNGDGGLDIVAAPFSETLTVLDGTSGKELDNSHWPLHNLESTYHASPLQVKKNH